MAARADTATDKILRLMWHGGEWSKRGLSEATGLSLASCNLVLNELARAGAVIGIKQSNGHAGRNSLLWRIDEQHSPVLCVRVELASNESRGGSSAAAQRAMSNGPVEDARSNEPRPPEESDGQPPSDNAASDCSTEDARSGNACWHVSLDVVSVLGNVQAHHEETLDTVTPENLIELIKAQLASHKTVAQLALGVPGNIAGDEILDCDAPTLEGHRTMRELRALGLPCLAINDVHAMAYGYYRSLGNDDEVVSVAFFPEDVMPGMATVYQGTVLEGASGMAGMLGFAPLAEGTAGVRAAWHGMQGRVLAARSLASLVCAVNPSAILCSGSLLDATAIDDIAAQLAEWIPASHLPRLVWRNDLGEMYLQGLLGRALEERL